MKCRYQCPLPFSHITYTSNYSSQCSYNNSYIIIFLLFPATPHPAITQEREQVGVATHELTNDTVSQHCESEMVI